MMSREIDSQLQKIFSVLRPECAKRLTVKEQARAGPAKQISLSARKALSERIRRGVEDLAKRRGKISYAQIAERSGNLITEGAITNLLSQRVGNPTALTLYGLAKALEIDPHELFDAALGIIEPEGFQQSKWWSLYAAYERLEQERHKRKIEKDLEDLETIIGAFPKRRGDGQAKPIRKLK